MRVILGLFLLLILALPAKAQDALVVQSCGTIPQAYAAGSTRQPTVDINGNLCTSSGGVQTFQVTAAPYNAKCDGTTNDTAAIQAAVTAWKAAGPSLGGTTVLAGPGTGRRCRVTGPIDFTNTNALSMFGGVVRDLWLYGVFNYLGPVGTVAITVPGTGYANGAVNLTGGTGTGCTGTITTLAGAITAIVLAAPGCGTGYTTGDVLTVSTGNGDGRVTVSTLSGGAIIDAVGSRFITWDNVITEGDCTSIPNAGWAIGRYNGVSADMHHFRSIKSLGCWQFAGFYNGASESLQFDHMMIFTSRAAAAYYGLVQDGANHFNWSSTFKTFTEAIDTTQSLNGNQFNNLNILVASSAAATPIWMEHAFGHKFIASYAAGVGTCGVIIYAPTAGLSSFQLYFDMHFETGAMVNTFCLRANANNFNLNDFEYYDYFSAVTTAIFNIDATVTTVLAYGIRVQITQMAALATVYGTPASWTVAPIRIEVPVVGNYVAPGVSRAGGWICIGAAICTAS